MLTFSSVQKQFQKVKAVDKLSFGVKKGEIFALLGPNGAGKTTAVRMIMQIIEPDSGTIIFDPSFIKNGRIDRSRLGYLPEERGLYQDVPLLKTLIYLATLRGSNPKQIRKKAQKWLERFDLCDRKDEKISTLSKGNQQKVQFIASILHEPDFVVLDEPFSGFDPINQERISDTIRELRNSGMTVLLSAHQMQLVENIADHILMIREGRKLLSGTLDEIRSQMISDQKLVVEYKDEVTTDRFETSACIKSFTRTENGNWEIYPAENTNLNDVLTELVAVGTILQLKTSDVTLHEIFIQSFKTNKEGAES